MRIPTVTMLALAGTALAIPAALNAAIYLEIPGVPGESRSSGDEKLDYLTITLTDAAAERVRVLYVVQADDHSAGDEHEIEYSVVAGRAPPPPPGPQRVAANPQPPSGSQSAGSEHEFEYDVAGSVDEPPPGPQRITAAPRAPRADGPGSLKLGQALPGCRVGTRYDHVRVGEDGTIRAVLRGVQVTQCSAEEVTLNYTRVEQI